VDFLDVFKLDFNQIVAAICAALAAYFGGKKGANGNGNGR
jgi:hypothetical protein